MSKAIQGRPQDRQPEGAVGAVAVGHSVAADGAERSWPFQKAAILKQAREEFRPRAAISGT